MTTQRRGPFDRLLGANAEPTAGPPQGPDRAAVYIAGAIIGLALLLLVLLVPPISILSRGGGSGSSADAPGKADSITATRTSGMPKLPGGLAAASAYYRMAAPDDQRGAARISVPLNEATTDARMLGLYSYTNGAWQRLSDVTLISAANNVTLGRGEVAALPGNVAVLRRSKSALQIAGLAPAGSTVDERAANTLTVLHPVVFLPAADGGLVGDSPAVPPSAYRVVPVIIAPAPEVVDDILRSTDVTNAHVAALAAKVREGNFAGISVDYRSVSPALRKQYAQFIARLHDALASDGRTLTVVLPMPATDNGQTDTGAYDWDALGKSVESIELAGELDQELYFQRTEAALRYITEHVDASKVLIAVNARSVERGGDGLHAMSLQDALTTAATVSVKTPGDITAGTKVTLLAPNLATSEGATGLHWDDAARAVTYSYTGLGGRRTVWIANAFSAAFRIELAQRYHLAGIVVDDVSQAGGGGDVWTPAQQAADAGSLTLSKPNSDLFAPAWTADQGALAPQSGDTVTWTAPAQDGSYSVTIIVSDGLVRAAQPVALDVVP